MKRIAILLSFLVTSASALLAQNYSVKGSVYDFDSAEPMYPANVQVFQISGTDSTYVTGAATEEDGSFVINNLKTGNYVARATFMGYDNADKNFTIRSGTTVTSCTTPTARRRWPRGASAYRTRCASTTG